SDSDRLVTCAGVRGALLASGPTVRADSERISPWTVPPSSCTWPPNAIALPVTVPRTSRGPWNDPMDPLTVVPAGTVRGPDSTADRSIVTPLGSRPRESTRAVIESPALGARAGARLVWAPAAWTAVAT